MLKELKPGDLKAEVVINEEDIPGPKDKLDRPIELVGQDRAEKAFDLALLKEGHIAVVGNDTISPEMMRDLIRKKVSKDKKAVLRDKLYVFDFDNPPGAKLLVFRAGKGREFMEDIGKISEEIIILLSPFNTFIE